MGTLINGVIVTPLKQIHHPKGDVFHAIKKTDPGFVDFGEAYFSSVKTGLVKAWKKHSLMTLNLVCIKGEIHFVLYDDRETSSTNGDYMEITLSPENNYCRLTVPPGVWMGFKGLDRQDSLLLNLADVPHDPAEQQNVAIEESDIVFNWNNINIKK